MKRIDLDDDIFGNLVAAAAIVAASAIQYWAPALGKGPHSFRNFLFIYFVLAIVLIFALHPYWKGSRPAMFLKRKKAANRLPSNEMDRDGRLPAFNADSERANRQTIQFVWMLIIIGTLCIALEAATNKQGLLGALFVFDPNEGLPWPKLLLTALCESIPLLTASAILLLEIRRRGFAKELRILLATSTGLMICVIAGCFFETIF